MSWRVAGTKKAYNYWHREYCNAIYLDRLYSQSGGGRVAKWLTSLGHMQEDAGSIPRSDEIICKYLSYLSLSYVQYACDLMVSVCIN